MILIYSQSKRIVCVLLCFFSFFFGKGSLAQNSKDQFDITLRNHSVMRVNVCSDRIFRVRVSPDGNFPETLMERYGIIKTDWEQADAVVKTVKGNRVISTSGYQVVVCPKTGEISVNDKTGKSVMERIGTMDSESPSFKELGKHLNDYFGKTTGEKIIGADYSKKDVANEEMDEVGDITHSRAIEISLKGDERFYGGGNTSRENIQHRGSALRMWATYQKTEIPVPFMMSTSGWGIFDNTTAKNYFDMGCFNRDKFYVFNTDGSADFYIMVGKSMPELINSYTLITGRPYLLPKWMYGLSFGANQMEDQMGLMNNAVRFREETIPCDLFWIEPQWMKKHYDFSTSKNWNFDKFEGEPFWNVKNFPKKEYPTLFISKLHGLGYKLALWLCIDHDMTIAAEDRVAEKRGVKQSGKEHWFQHLTTFMDEGVDGFKLDPAHTLDEHTGFKYYNGYTDKEMHNLNQVLLQKQMNETFRKHKGIRDFQHYCGGYAGAQHWGAFNSGDNGGGRTALYDQLNLSFSGIINNSADVMEEVRDNLEGMHFGFFLPWVQINSWYDLLHPWYMSPGEKAAFCYYSQLRHQLFPYIYSTAIEGTLTGMPIVRAMPLVFPDDRKVDNMIYQFMFGENFLVGVSGDSIYLPKGNWIDYWTGRKYTGEKTVYCPVPSGRGGLLFVRGGSVIPYQMPMQYIGQSGLDTLKIQVYPDGKSSFTLLEDDGITYDYEKGKIARTKFECADTERETELTILPCEGTYNGIYLSRTYEWEINLPEKPSRILVNGSAIKDWQYDASGKVLLSVFQKDVRQKLTVNIFK
jgi:alpha-glucosidase (family GH31 glycosyl hydrolase)